MPLPAQRFYRDFVQDRGFTPFTTRTRAPRMAAHAISIPVTAFDEGRRRGKRVAALGAEEVIDVVGVAARNDNLTLDGCLAGAAAWGEELVEIQVTVEAEGVILEEKGVFARHGLVLTVGAGDAQAIEAGGVGLWVEGDAFQRCVTVVAGEAFRVKTSLEISLRVGTGCCDDSPGDGESAT